MNNGAHDITHFDLYIPKQEFKDLKDNMRENDDQHICSVCLGQLADNH